jgi:hypothetical protein
MRWRARWSHVTIALAVIAALVIATPVFGISKGIKKAIKREVSKQIANATGPTGPPGAAGNTGATGAPGGPRAYGLVSDAGTLSRSQNVATVTKPFTGIYCIVLPASINANTAVLVVGPDSSDNETSTGGDDHSYVEWNSEGTDCPANALEVFTFLYRGDTTDNADGSVTAPGDDLAADDESFSFMVP